MQEGQTIDNSFSWPSGLFVSHQRSLRKIVQIRTKSGLVQAMKESP